MHLGSIKIALVASILVTAVVIAVLYATVFHQRGLSAVFNVSAPAVWFEDPRTPGVTVLLARSNTTANITASAIPDLVLARRSALYYDTFDTNPIGTRLLAYTCTWTYDSTRGLVNITAASRSNSTWGYWCVLIVNSTLLNISSYVMGGRAVYVSFVAFRSGFIGATPTIRISALYLNSTSPIFYDIGFELTIRTGRGGDTHTSLIALQTSTSRTSISSRSLGILTYFEYDYLYHVSTAMNFTDWNAAHYVDDTFTHSSIIATANRYVPYAVGIGYWSSTTGYTGTISFDNFIATVDNPPWFVNVTGLPDGWRVLLRNSTRGVVANVSVTNGLAVLPVAPRSTDLTGFLYNSSTDTGYVFRNATIEVYDVAGRLVANRTFDVVLGGDLYSFRYVFNGTLLSIYSNLTRGFNNKLELAQQSAYLCGTGFNASIGLVNRTLILTSPNITIVNGLAVSHETGMIEAYPPVTWTGQWLAANITATIAFPFNITSCYLTLRYKWWISEAAIAIYLVNLNITRT